MCPLSLLEARHVCRTRIPTEASSFMFLTRQFGMAVKQLTTAHSNIKWLFEIVRHLSDNCGIFHPQGLLAQSSPVGIELQLLAPSVCCFLAQSEHGT